jgi:chaperonin GroES
MRGILADWRGFGRYVAELVIGRHPRAAGRVDTGGKSVTIVPTMATIKPIGDRVFLQAIEEDRVTKSGIVLPDTAEKERPVKGRVIAVGAGKRNDKGEISPMSVKVGDVVLFKKYGPDEVELDGVKYLAAEESDILAVLEG